MSCEVGGEVFLNLLKMLVVPLVMSSVMSGILGLGNVRKLGKPGAAAVGYYICTTILAVVVGLVVVNVIRPGVGAVDEDTLAEMELPPEDVEVLNGVQASTLKEYARQIKMRLMVLRS